MKRVVLCLWFFFLLSAVFSVSIVFDQAFDRVLDQGLYRVAFAKESTDQMDGDHAKQLVSDLESLRLDLSRPDYRKQLSDLASHFMATEDFVRAAWLYDVLAKQIASDLSPDHESLINVFKKMSTAHDHLRNFKKSEKYEDLRWLIWSIDQAMKKNPVWNHEESVALQFCDLADYYISINHDSDALILFKKAKNIFANLSRGFAHPKSIEISHSIEFAKKRLDRKLGQWSETGCDQKLR